MIEGKRILAVVPARGGSKGVPHKNIRPVLGIPLIAFTANTINACPFIDRAVVSTDSPEIARAAEKEGLSAPFFRPESLSGDRIADWDVLAHALTKMEELDDVRYDVVLMLQPTSPLRSPQSLKEVVDKLVFEDFDSVWTVSATDFKYHPLKQLNISGEGRLAYFDPAGATIIARQQLEPVYHRNGIAYAINRDCLLSQRKIMGKNAGAVLITEPSVNIDTLDDFEKFERLLLAQSDGKE